MTPTSTPATGERPQPSEWYGIRIVASEHMLPDSVAVVQVCPRCNGMDPEEYTNDPPHTLCPTCKGMRLVAVAVINHIGGPT